LALAATQYFTIIITAIGNSKARNPHLAHTNSGSTLTLQGVVAKAG
jgi:hypothetical protein